MEISLSDAKAKLTELVKRAEEGEEVILTRHGAPIARIEPVKTAIDKEAYRRVLDSIRASGRANAKPGPCAARSQDFLYDEFGLPK